MSVEEGPVAPPTTVVVQSDLVGVKAPSFDWQASDLAQQFKSFRRYCELILKTPTYANKPKEDLVNYILLWMGPQGVEIFDNLTLDNEKKKTQQKYGQLLQNT